MKKAIEIGATSGIGKGISNLLVENLFTVGITGRRTNLLQEMKTEHLNFFEIATLLCHVSELGGSRLWPEAYPYRSRTL